MARENINAGAGTLAAMSQNVAQMGALRNQNNALMMEHLNNFTRGLTEWQRDFDERKRAKWLQDMEQAKFDEQKRLNDTNIELARAENARAEQKLPAEIALTQAQAGNARAGAYSTNTQTNQFKKDMETINKINTQIPAPPPTDNKPKTLIGKITNAVNDATSGKLGTTLGIFNPIKRQ